MPGQTPVGQPASKKRPILVSLNYAKKARPSGRKRVILEKREPKEYPVSPPFLCSAKKAATLLEQEMKD